MNSLMGRLGAFTVRRRWYVIGAWMVLLAVMASFASGLTDRLGSGGFEVPGSQSLAVQRDLERIFRYRQETLRQVFAMTAPSSVPGRHR